MGMKDYEAIKHKKKNVLVLSVILGICGFAVFVSGVSITFMSNLSDGQSAKEMNMMDFLQTAGSAIVICMGLGIIALSVQGCFLAMPCMPPCCIPLWGCGLGCVSAIVFIFGCMFAASNSFIGSYIDYVCTPKPAFSSSKIYSNSNSADTGMGDIVNTKMCTTECPCDATAFAAGYNGFSNYAYYGRSSANMVKTGNIKSFQQCWETVLAAKETNKQKVASVNAYLASMKTFETKIPCSGVCEPALTWYTKEISTRPPGGCKKKVIDVVGSGYTIPGYILIFTSLIILILFFYQYSLWCMKCGGNGGEPQWNN